MLTFIIGTSGSGKTTFANKYFGENNAVVSITTRPKRVGEVEGVDYYFVDESTFHELDSKGLLGEKTYYAGNYYGITKEELKNKAIQPNSFSLVDYHGYSQLVGIMDDMGISYQVLYFTIDEATVRERLTKRGDKPEDIERRMKQINVDEYNNRGLYNDPNCLIIDATGDIEDVYDKYLQLKKKRGNS